ncbi:MAG: hypothetical protein J2O38_07905 [Acidimicrobiales bacterium]|nr:hypothetical protein [Acidimicrobiales bacterium]
MIRVPHDHHGDPQAINQCPECRAWAIERLVEQSDGPCVHFAYFADGRSASAAADELVNCRTRVEHSALQEAPWALLVGTNGDPGIRAVVERHGGTYGGVEATVDAATGEAVIDPDGP